MSLLDKLHSRKPGGVYRAPGLRASAARPVASGWLEFWKALLDALFKPKPPLPPPGPSDPPVGDLSIDEAELWRLTNLERVRAGVKPLALNATLQMSARQWAVNMASRERMYHSADNVWENIAAGQVTPAETVDDWMGSTGHRRNLLDPGRTVAGMAVATGVVSGTRYWVWQAV